MNEKKAEDIEGPVKPPKDDEVPFIMAEKPAGNEKRHNAMNEGEHSRSLDEQVKHLERKIRAYSKAKDKVNEGEALSSLGILYYKANRFAEAKSCHERHLNLAKAIQNKRAEKRAYCNLGCTYRRIGDLDKAVECYEQGLRLVKELEDRLGEAKLLNNLGNIFEQRSDFDQAVYCHQKRLSVARELKDLDGESKACASLGNIYHLLGNIRESINYYEKLVACLKYKLAMQEKKSKSEEGSEDCSMPGSSSNKMRDDSKKSRARRGSDLDEQGSNSSKSSGDRSGNGSGKGSSIH